MNISRIKVQTNLTICIEAVVDIGEFRLGDHPIHVLVRLQVQHVDDAVHVQLGVDFTGGVGDINVGRKGKMRR